jgi:hypothetical protein
MTNIHKLLIAGLFGSLAVIASAQTTPAGTVDSSGNLVIGDQVIAPPAGTVTAEGNLDLGGGVVITKPVATVNTDGSLTVGDTTYPVPSLPKGGSFIINWFGNDLFDFRPAVGPETSQWYFSFTFKNMYHFAAGNFFYMQELDASFYFDPNSGNKSLRNGVWAWSNTLFPNQPATGTWIYISDENGFNDLRDSQVPGTVRGDGTLDLTDSQAGSQVLNGYFYIMSPAGYDAGGPGFFFFSEFGDGNWITRAGTTNWVKLSDPVQ